MEEPLASPVTTAELLQQAQQLEVRISLQLQRISRTEKEITVAELPATAPVSVPAPATVPRTPDGT